MSKEQLSTPKFGEPPPPAPQVRKRVFRYSTMLEKVREYPGQWAQVAVFDEGPPSRTAARIQSVSGEFLRYLRKYFPLEVWDISHRTIADTWNKRELWVRYHGTITHEQAAELRQARRERFLQGRANAARRRMARETHARIKGMAANKEIAQIAVEQRRQFGES